MYRKRNVVLVCLVFTFVVHVFGDYDCKSQQTCAECIRTPRCIWCSEERNPETKDTRPRCMEEISVAGTKTKSSNSWCPNNMQVKPDHYKKIIDDLPFSAEEDNQVQVTPQRVKMVLRIGQEETIKISYKQAKNYPVDLYFLMDLSASMEDHKNKLSTLGTKLVETMKELTSNVRLGFGSFVDKVLLPMTSTQEGWLDKFCHLKGTNQRCAPPYGYKHQMKLTHKTSEFKANVEAAPISGNIDTPEGGLDATMQAMVCGEEIGWRNNSRRMLVYSSDSTYHIAGDGRLAGVIEPNDEECHLNETGFYTHAELLDYPSISQINRQAREKNINIIFAVTDNTKSVYDTLSKSINGSRVGVLSNNSRNVVDLVRKNYEELTKTVTMVHDSTSMLEVKYKTRCTNPDESLPAQERNECSNVHVDTKLDFEVTIKAVGCPERREDWKQTISIHPQGVNERVLIEVELSCDCPCSRPGDKQYVENSPKCNRNGNLTCGICDCNEGYSGKQCKCAGDDGDQQSSTSDTWCKKDENSTICSGQGVCSCGACKCNPGPNEGDEFSGEFCECNNFSCTRNSDMVCSGPDNGKCVCGTCQCKPGWGGEDCGCRTSNSTCIPAQGENREMCSGFGDCICGSCNCTTEGRSGSYCEECPTCPTERCDELKDCVECEAYKTGPKYNAELLCQNCQLGPTLVDDIDENPRANHSVGTHVCTVLDSSGCTFVFTYKSIGRADTDILEINAEKERKCPLPPASAYGVAGGAIGATLFLGLIGLLIWKLLTMFHDHREWVKFEKERVSAKWDSGENPLFKEPTSSFKNPTFDGVKG